MAQPPVDVIHSEVHTVCVLRCNCRPLGHTMVLRNHQTAYQCPHCKTIYSIAEIHYSAKEYYDAQTDAGIAPKDIDMSKATARVGFNVNKPMVTLADTLPRKMRN